MRRSTMGRRTSTARSAATLVSVLACTGCATMFSGGPDLVPVSSSPDRAHVFIDGVAVGMTPCTIAINRTAEGVVRVEYPGYAPATVDRDKVVNGWFFANLISPWFIGFRIDLLTSNQGKYSTDPIFVELYPVTPSK
jgi:hypothetical protein